MPSPGADLSLVPTVYGSAYGGCSGQDGASGVTVHLSNIYVTPIEIIETEFPCRVAVFGLQVQTCIPRLKR